MNESTLVIFFSRLVVRSIQHQPWSKIGCIDCSAKTFHLAQAAYVPCETLHHKTFVLITSQLANFSCDGVRGVPRVTEGSHEPCNGSHQLLHKLDFTKLAQHNAACAVMFWPLATHHTILYFALHPLICLELHLPITTF